MAGSSTREAERRRLVTVAFSLMVVFVVPTAALGSVGQATVSTTVPVGAYEVVGGRDGHELTVDGFGRLLVPGKPALPSRIFAIAIPPGAELAEVTFDAGPGVALPGSYRVRPAQLPRVIGDEDPLLYAADQAQYKQNYDAVYGSDQAYPANTVEFVRRAGYRKYNLVDVRVTPFTYHPLSGRLLYHPDITVHVHYRLSETPARVMVDNLARTERIAEADALRSW